MNGPSCAREPDPAGAAGETPLMEPTLAPGGLLRQALDQAPGSLAVTDRPPGHPEGRFLYVNRAFGEMTGYRPEELLHRPARVLRGPATDGDALERMRARAEAGEPAQGAAVHYRKGGTPFLMAWEVSPVRDEQGEIRCFASSHRDLTRQGRSGGPHRAILESLGVGVLCTDAAGRLTFLNPAALDFLGYAGQGELLGRDYYRVTHPNDPDPRLRNGNAGAVDPGPAGDGAPGAWRDRFRGRRGAAWPVEVCAAPLEDPAGAVPGQVLAFWDASDRVRMEEELRYQADHDPLTELYNRSALETRLDQEIHRAGRYGESLALIMFDLDHFKAVNDRYGHQAGDRALKEVAALARQELRASDILGRWGGEEFLILLPETGLPEAEETADRVRRKIAGTRLRAPDGLTVSLGVVELAAEETRSQLFQRLDRALYRAKDGGRNRVTRG